MGHGNGRQTYIRTAILMIEPVRLTTIQYNLCGGYGGAGEKVFSPA